MRYLGMLLVLACMFLPGKCANATPSRFTWHCEQLLGFNDEHYFYWVIEHTNPGSHIEYSQRLILRKARQSDRSVAEEILVREVHGQDTSAYAHGFWTANGVNPGAFDLAAYLQANHVSMAFPIESVGLLGIDSAGVFLRGDSLRTRVLSRWQLDSLLPNLGEVPRIVRMLVQGPAEGVRAFGNIFYVVQSGHPEYELDWREELLVIPEKWLPASADVLWKIRFPWR